MPTRCIVAGCGNTNKEGTSLHRFPKDEKLRKLWTSRVKLTRAKWQGPSDNSVICSEHFDESDFEDEGLWSDFGLKRLKKLKPDAIPKIKSKLEKSSTEGKGRKKSRPGIEKRKKMKVSAMDGPSESQNSSPSVIYLHDVHTSDVWMQQRNIFFEQRQHHDSEILGDVSKRDGEFVFHLLEVHAKFCLKPNSCQPIGGDDNIQKSNVTGLQVSTSVMIAAPSTSSTSDFVDEKPSITSMTYIDQETGLAFPNHSQETTGGWIPEQPRANWESPDMSHDLTAVSLSRVIKLEKEDDVPEDASIDALGAALHNWIPEQPVVKFELPGTSHDHQMDVITAVVKSEEEDEANEGLIIGEWVEGETNTKRARIVSTKLDKRELPSECRSCHKVLEDRYFYQDSRHGKCDACMKKESCPDQQTEQVISPEAPSPRRDSAHDPEADRTIPSCSSYMAEEPGKECHEQDIRYEMPSVSNRCPVEFNQSDPLAFTYTGNLKTHIQTHTGERQLKCNQCAKAFACEDTLQIHMMRTHTGERPFKCHICPKAFNERTHLSAHMRIHTGEKPFKCSTCSKWFREKSTLGKHMRTHTGEKPFKCSTCSVSFSRKASLTRHMRTHTGERPFKCHICPRAFIERTLLNRHMRTHTRPVDFN